MALKSWLSFLISFAFMTAVASDRKSPDENFMLVLREVEGANKQEFGFTPSGPGTGTLSNGESITLTSAWFDLIGDMHVRFVIDGERTMRNLTAQEFAAYGLSPEEAVTVAIRNIKARYGEPHATPWEGGIMLVSGQSSDLDSSYFLDRAFWDKLLLKYPEGVVVGVPKRGGLIFAPMSDKTAVTLLERNIRSLYETSENLRVSSVLYLYKGGKWTVHRAPAS
ncbi:MAG TPA: hypothetical protein VGO61_05140 [Steroidobacteraceae bacterium]|nr:hypothetical protein [Steroidobacteraceae bacterium]